MALGSVEVLVLVDAPYMTSAINEVVNAKRGEIVKIASGWYVDKMCKLGNVHFLQDGDDIEQILAVTEPVASEEELQEIEASATTELVNENPDPAGVPQYVRRAKKVR